MSCARKCNDCTQCLAALPEGKTCADCAHIRRCLSFGFTEAENEACDFIPSRWRSNEPVSAAKDGAQ